MCAWGRSFAHARLAILGAAVLFVAGTIVSNLSNLDPDGDEFTQSMSELNKMMRRERLPDEMRIRLRQYFYQTAHMRQAQKRHELLHLMSPTLRSEVRV